MAQTAVNWFFEVLAHNDIVDHKKLCDDENLYNLLYSLKNQAQQKEKVQSKFFFDCGRQYQLTGEGTFTEAYNDTYGKNSNDSNA